MGKYEPLGRFLERAASDCVDAGFSQIENILGFGLPRSAYRYPAWWANESHGSHSHSRSWQDAGWETSRLDLPSQKVRFVRTKTTRHPPSKSLKAPDSNAALWDKAHRLSGIEDREALIQAALTALIRREAASQLTAMGGTMPDFAAPERERPTW